MGRSDPAAMIDNDDQPVMVCLECGAEDVLYLPHAEGCTREGDIVTR